MRRTRAELNIVQALLDFGTQLDNYDFCDLLKFVQEYYRNLGLPVSDDLEEMIFVLNDQRVDGSKAKGKTYVLSHFNAWYCFEEMKCGDNTDGIHDGALACCVRISIALCVRLT